MKKDRYPMQKPSGNRESKQRAGISRGRKGLPAYPSRERMDEMQDVKQMPGHERGARRCEALE